MCCPMVRPRRPTRPRPRVSSSPTPSNPATGGGLPASRGPPAARPTLPFLSRPIGASMTLATERPTGEEPVAGCPRRRGYGTGHGHRMDQTPGGSASAGEHTVEDRPPRLADGVQLLGEYTGTGYRERQHIARRPGGRMVQLSRLLHLVAEQCDGSTSHQQIAARVSGGYGKTVSPDNVRTLVEGKLRPLGVLAAADGSSPPAESSDPLLALKLRTQLLRPGIVGVLARATRPMFWPPVVVAVLAGLMRWTCGCSSSMAWVPGSARRCSNPPSSCW